jgi:hypothetical protein
MENLEVKVMIVLVTIVLGGLMFLAGNNYNARLNALEAASTVAQQPNGRGYFKVVDSSWHYSENDTIVIPNGYRGVTYTGHYYKYLK